MSSNSKKILRKLAEKPAILIEALTKDPLAFGTPPSQGERKTKYAVNRALKNLVDSGYAEIHKTDRQDYAKITPYGKTRLNSMTVEAEDALVPQTWDGFWRIILLDLPENRKSERESLRYLLKKACFVCLKNSAWISPYPFEHLFMNIKKDLGLTTEMVILTTNNVDEISKKIFFQSFSK